MTNKIFSALKVVTLAVALSFGLSYVYAWTAPSTTPPTGNVSAPINTGADLQSKGGGLTVKNFIADTVTVGAVPNLGAISSPKFCIGASCITAWTEAGAVTKLTAGTNISLSPAGGTGDVTVNAVGGLNSGSQGTVCLEGVYCNRVSGDMACVGGIRNNIGSFAPGYVVDATWNGSKYVGNGFTAGGSNPGSGFYCARAGIFTN